MLQAVPDVGDGLFEGLRIAVLEGACFVLQADDLALHYGYMWKTQLRDLDKAIK